MEGHMEFVGKETWSLYGRPLRVCVEGHLLEIVIKATWSLCERSLGVCMEDHLEFV